MAEYKNAFAPEQQTLGVEGVFGIVPLKGAFSRTENDLLQPSFYRGRSGLTYMPSTTCATVDETELLEAAAEEVVRRHRLRPLKELEELDKKVQEADKALADAGGYLMALAATLRKYAVPMPCVTLEYRDLSVRTDALVGSASIPTVGNSFKSVLRRLVCMKEGTVEFPILDSLSGVILPGRPTLLLGPPASGKSTLLKVLAGRYKSGANLRVTGDLRYNGYKQDEFVVERTAAYVDQHDNHIPALTVMETLEFAHTCQLGSKGGGFDMPGELRRAIQAAKAKGQRPEPTAGGMTDEELLELLSETFRTGVSTLDAMRSMGIAHTANTPIGDAMLRGVSGGERKRVTTAEMLVGRRRLLLLDEISTGLDSATLYSIADLLCKACRAHDLTVLVSLLQPPPEVYFLFDDVMLMSGGHVTFHGPVDQALPFYKSLGFACPPRKDVPSFLQEVATASGQQELAGPGLRDQAKRHTLAEAKDGEAAMPGSAGSANWVVPPQKVVEAYWESEAGRNMRKLLDQPFKKEDGHPHALTFQRFALKPMDALLAVLRRQLLLVSRDKVLLKGRLVQVMIMGLITGSLFFQLEDNLASARQFFGVSFLAIMFMAMGAMPAIPVTMATKSVWYKHRAASFYPAWCHALGANLAQMPASLLEAMLYSIILYFMVGYYHGAGQFFLFFLVLASFSITCNILYRLIAYTVPNPVAANAFGGFLLLILILLSGFSIIRGSIPDYWIWAYYISPFSWALRCIVINEFTSPAWNAPAFPGSDQTIGQAAMGTFDFFTTHAWFWGGIGYLWGLSIVLIGLSSLSLKSLSGDPPVARVADPEELQAAREKAAKARAKAAAVTAAAAAGTATSAAMVALTDPSGRLQLGSVGTANGKEGSSADGREDKEGVSVGVLHVSLDVGKLPHIPITLVFEDLRYFVPNPSYTGKSKKAEGAPEVPERLELLKGITGYAAPGTMTALMGGSGAGKTTLMDVIAGRKTVGEITGDIWVNGHPKEQGSWARSSGYVEQMDIHTPATTVLEALLFSARLRLPKHISQAAVRAFVDSVINMVELGDVMFNLVGLPGGGGAGLNVDARKRLTLAVELVANPSVVFMDEPTSGLDARAASIVMRAIRNVAADGRTVMVTIHQPSIEIFESFNQLLLLQRGGRTTYFGPLGADSKGLVDYLQGAVPGVEPLPEGYNPATWMLEVTGAAKAVRIKAVEGVDWPQVYAGSALAKDNAARARQLVEDSRQKHPEPLAVAGKYAAGLPTQVRALLHKFTMAYWRTPSYNFVRLAMTIVIGLVYGSIYWGEGTPPNPAGIGSVQNVMGVLYSSSSFLGMLGMNAVMPLLGFERVVYYREQAVAMYSPWAYGIVMAVVEGPYLFVQVLIFVGIVYPMIHFQGEPASFFFYLCLVFEALGFYLSFGTALVYLTPSQQLAQVAGSAFNSLFNLFNGFVIPYPSIPVYYKWANRLSPTTWVLYGLAADQLGNVQTPFLAPGEDTPTTTVANFLNQSFGYDYGFRLWCLLIVAGYMIGLRVIGILALRYISYLRR